MKNTISLLLLLTLAFAACNGGNKQSESQTFGDTLRPESSTVPANTGNNDTSTPSFLVE